MAYTSPKTYSVGDVLTASDMNTYQRDNISYLYDLVFPLARCRVTKTTNFNSTTSLTAISWETEVFDTDTMYDAGDPTKITITTAGVYIVTGLVVLQSGTAGSYRIGAIYRNGNTGDTDTVASSALPAMSTSITGISLASIFDFSASDYIELKIQSGETETVTSAQMAVARIG